MSASVQSGNARCRDLSLDLLLLTVDPVRVLTSSPVDSDTYPNLRATYCGISCMHFKVKFYTHEVRLQYNSM